MKLLPSFVVLALCCTSFLHAETPLAFPGAEGAGAIATGGRGGKIVHVTNLDADGPGSLQDAVSAPNRIVVFDVSGIIDLQKAKAGADKVKKEKVGKSGKGGFIEMSQPNVTVEGQTAPGEGICLKNGGLHISADNVIVRFIRSRRDVVREGTAGDAIEVKPDAKGERLTPNGQTPEALDKRKQKKAERGKIVNDFDSLKDIVIDHCSTSWATDENLTVTHADRSTVSYCIAAEGLDYANPKQTPPNHSEGSLWGSSVPDGRSTMHHMLYAHNRLRNPRTVGGAEIPPVLTLYNNVVYDWSEYPTHTGSERVHVQWLNNFYQAGPSTPAEIRGSAFQFHGDPLARVFAKGNWIEGDPVASKDNQRAVGWSEKKFKRASAEDKAAMLVDHGWTPLPVNLQNAAAARETVLAEAGATLPARDAVDLRIVQSVRDGTGRVIERESDLPEDQRWPHYHSLPSPTDSDGDGLPDFWEKQFGLNPDEPGDAAKISAGGYANIEHWCNNTDPTGGTTPIVFVAATISRAHLGKSAEWRITRTGDTSAPLEIRYEIGGDADAARDFEKPSGSLTIPAGKSSVTLALTPRPTARDGAVVVIRLAEAQAGFHVGCPPASLIVICP